MPKGKVPEAGMEYLRKLRDLKYYETIYELIAKQFEMAKLDEARQGAVIQVADVAVPPDKKSSPPRLHPDHPGLSAWLYGGMRMVRLPRADRAHETRPGRPPRLEDSEGNPAIDDWIGPAMIYADQRWIGDHGIGRFARRVLDGLIIRRLR